MSGQKISDGLTEALALAAKIAQKANDALSNLDREMTIMKWPTEYRAIMWRAVAEEALRRAETK